ncbi:hypothetical protein ACTXLT_09130 [Brachybacterium alimentarium]|uniref:hypothetical protein n=1 Tax=Brachybacterium alimentarium TaxID=47845 RepID=UPI00403DF372
MSLSPRLARGPLENCPDCDGEVLRNYRRREGLGELWEVPLEINTIAEPMSPRRPGPGILTLALATTAQAVTR